MQDMNELQANAWIYWQAVENGEKGNWWGLMQVLPKTFYRYIDNILCLV
jgi:hypothetical protein